MPTTWMREKVADVVVPSIIASLLGAGSGYIAYVRNSVQIEDRVRSAETAIVKLEKVVESVVSRQDFERFQDATQRQLDRIDTKLDNLRTQLMNWKPNALARDP